MGNRIYREIPGKVGNMIYTETHVGVLPKPVIFPGICITRVTGGSGAWQIGGELCQIKKDDLIFLSNLEPRRIVSDSGDLSIAAFSFMNALPASVGAEECLRVFYSRSKSFTHVLDSPALVKLHESVRNEILLENPSPGLILAFAIELLVLAGREYDKKLPGSLDANFRCDGTTAAVIAASAAYICDHLTEPLRVSELAGRAGMSVGHYTRMFVKYASMTPADYIAHCRIRLFCSMFRGGKSNVLDTALACGFTSSSGFYKTYRRVCGHAPTSLQEPASED